LADIVNVEAVATDFAGGVVEGGHNGFPFGDAFSIAGGYDIEPDLLGKNIFVS
jgi:hypothetical protein